MEKLIQEFKENFIKEKTEELEKLIGSKSSDYNKGVQDCINIFKSVR